MLSHSYPVSHPRTPQFRNRHFKRKAWGMIFSCSFITLPMAAIALAMLVIVFKHQINTSLTGNDLFETTGYLDGLCTEPSYIIKYRAGTIPFLASVIGKVASYLSAPAMTLISFNIAYDLMQSSTELNPTRLPSPFQTGLLISLLTGNAWSLWDVCKYLFQWRSRRVPITYVVKLALVTLSFVMCLRYENLKRLLTFMPDHGLT